MPLKYTGGASVLRIPGDPKEYKNGDIVPISQKDALHLQDQSSIHSFELTNTGEDLMDKMTEPDPEPQTFASDPVKDTDAKKGSK